MQGLNKVFLIGRLGQDPELRRTAKGSAWCRLNLATNRSVKKGEEWVEEAEWHQVVLWDQQAENAARLLKKGSPLFVEGRLTLNEWEDAHGHKHRDAQIQGERFTSFANRTAQRPEPEAPRAEVALPEEPVVF